MILAVDFVAQRYGMLPSQLLRDGTSLDLIVAQKAQSYQAKKQAEARDKAQGKYSQPDVPQLSEQQMLDMIAKVKDQHK